MAEKRIVLATFGSFGDLHPYLALAIELKARGYDPVIATVEMYRQKVEACGLSFRLLRTALVDKPDHDTMRRILDLRNGAEFLVRKLLIPALPIAYQDMLAATHDAALIIAHPTTFTARLAAEVQGIPWVSTQLAPMGFLSPHDPPAIPMAPFLTRFHHFGAPLFNPVFHLARRSTASWFRPYRSFRNSLGLPPIANPLFEGGHSPLLVLALFSRVLGDRQPDWPSQAVVTGFPLFDADDAPGLDPALEAFLDAGPAPIVFTLGTTAVMDAGRFYEESAQAAEMLHRRAVLLVGRDPANRPAQLPPGIAAFEYAPFSKLFPRAAAIVHQGGVGTTAQAMRSGHPMLVMPCTIDQPDNAARVERLGIARVLKRSRYSAATSARELNLLLSNRAYADRAAQVAELLGAEDGVTTACDHLEALVARTPKSVAFTAAAQSLVSTPSLPPAHANSLV